MSSTLYQVPFVSSIRAGCFLSCLLLVACAGDGTGSLDASSGGSDASMPDGGARDASGTTTSADSGDSTGGSTSTGGNTSTVVEGPPFPIPPRPSSVISETGSFKGGVCAVLEDHSIYCFDPEDGAEIDIGPPASENHGFVAVGGRSGLRESGEPVFWSDSGQVETGPEGEAFIETYTSANAGACALDASGDGDCIVASESQSFTGPYTQFVPTSRRWCGLRTDGSVDCFGIQGASSEMLNSSDDPIVIFDGVGDSLCGRTLSGSLRCWEVPEAPATTWSVTTIPVAGDIVEISYRGLTLCWVLREGSVGCWDRQLGVDRYVPFPGDEAFVDVLAVSAIICAVTDQGDLWCGDERDQQKIELPMPVLLPPPAPIWSSGAQ